MKKKSKKETIVEDEEIEEEYKGMDIEDLDEEEKEKLVEGEESEKEPTIVRKRYVVFTQPPRIGIVDSETKEIIAEGDTAMLEALANILERLERIEATLGSILGETSEE